VTGSAADLGGEQPSADPAVAAAQLAALRFDRAQMAERAMQPWWYDAVLGLMVFGLFASYSLWFPWLTLAAVALFGAGTRWLIWTYRRLTGTWVSGDRPGPTRRAWGTWLVLATVVLVPGMLLELVFDVQGAMVVAGGVLGIGIALVSRWWSRIYIAELREEL
jgi:hypothetical protein